MDARILEEVIKEQKDVFESKGEYIRRESLDIVGPLLKLPHALIYPV